MSSGWMKLGISIGMDYLISTGKYSNFTDSITGDYLVHYSQNTLIPYFLSTVDLNLPYVQLFPNLLKSYSNRKRFIISGFCSMVNALFSTCVNIYYPNVPAFQKNSVQKRILRRICLTCRRNGSLYNDFLNHFNHFSQIHDIFNYPIYEPIPKKILSNSQLTKILHPISDQINLNFLNFERADDHFYYYKSKLVDGSDVLLQIIPPFQSQLYEMNLFPFQVINFILASIPALNAEYILFDYFISQCNISLENEKRNRIQIMQNFGLDIHQSPSVLFQKTKQINFGLYISAPIIQASNDNVLVSEYYSVIPSDLNHQNSLNSAIIANSRLYTNFSQILPNLLPSNFISTEFGISLKSFSSLYYLDQNQIRNVLSNFTDLQAPQIMFFFGIF
jgi:hypothetical protein